MANKIRIAKVVGYVVYDKNAEIYGRRNITGERIAERINDLLVDDDFAIEWEFICEYDDNFGD